MVLPYFTVIMSKYLFIVPGLWLQVAGVGQICGLQLDRVHRVILGNS